MYLAYIVRTQLFYCLCYFRLLQIKEVLLQQIKSGCEAELLDAWERILKSTHNCKCMHACMHASVHDYVRTYIMYTLITFTVITNDDVIGGK